MTIMGGATVSYKNKYSSFSVLSHSFITKPMTFKQYTKWQKKNNLVSYFPSAGIRFISIEEAVDIICSNNEYRNAIKVLKEAKLLDKYTNGLVIDFYLNI